MDSYRRVTMDSEGVYTAAGSSFFSSFIFPVGGFFSPTSHLSPFHLKPFTYMGLSFVMFFVERSTT